MDDRFETLLQPARAYLSAARTALATRLECRRIDTEQRAAHGVAWLATSLAALEAVARWASGESADLDREIAWLAFAETIAQMVGGLPMGQNELFRPADLGLGREARDLAGACAAVLDVDHAEARAQVAKALVEGQWPSESLGDADLDAIRNQFRRFTDAEILPHAHKWHMANALIPEAMIRQMAELGTFGVCIPEDFGGLGLGKLVMC
ncbi:MAG: acyl-CoA dehydrogenase family protein, partial [Novosphingobium sp.]